MALLHPWIQPCLKSQQGPVTQANQFLFVFKPDGVTWTERVLAGAQSHLGLSMGIELKGGRKGWLLRGEDRRTGKEARRREEKGRAQDVVTKESSRRWPCTLQE